MSETPNNLITRWGQLFSFVVNGKNATANEVRELSDFNMDIQYPGTDRSFLIGFTAYYRPNLSILPIEWGHEMGLGFP